MLFNCGFCDGGRLDPDCVRCCVRNVYKAIIANEARAIIRMFYLLIGQFDHVSWN